MARVTGRGEGSGDDAAMRMDEYPLSRSPSLPSSLGRTSGQMSFGGGRDRAEGTTPGSFSRKLRDAGRLPVTSKSSGDLVLRPRSRQNEKHEQQLKTRNENEEQMKMQKLKTKTMKRSTSYENVLSASTMRRTFSREDLEGNAGMLVRLEPRRVRADSLAARVSSIGLNSPARNLTLSSMARSSSTPNLKSLGHTQSASAGGSGRALRRTAARSGNGNGTPTTRHRHATLDNLGFDLGSDDLALSPTRPRRTRQAGVSGSRVYDTPEECGRSQSMTSSGIRKSSHGAEQHHPQRRATSPDALEGLGLGGREPSVPATMGRSPSRQRLDFDHLKQVAGGDGSSYSYDSTPRGESSLNGADRRPLLIEAAKRMGDGGGGGGVGVPGTVADAIAELDQSFERYLDNSFGDDGVVRRRGSSEVYTSDAMPLVDPDLDRRPRGAGGGGLLGLGASNSSTTPDSPLDVSFDSQRPWSAREKERGVVLTSDYVLQSMETSGRGADASGRGRMAGSAHGSTGGSRGGGPKSWGVSPRVPCVLSRFIISFYLMTEYLTNLMICLNDYLSGAYSCCRLLQSRRWRSVREFVRLLSFCLPPRRSGGADASSVKGDVRLEVPCCVAFNRRRRQTVRGEKQCDII